MTKREWAAIAAKLASYYPTSFKLESTAQVQDWFEALADLPGAHVAAAVLHMVRTQSAFPSIADIRKHAEPQPLAWSDAWAEVMKVVGEVGYAGLPQWSDPVIARAVDALGGWQVVCQTPSKDQPTMRAQFRQAVEAANVELRRNDTFVQLGVDPPLRRVGSAKPLKELLDPNRHAAGLIGPGTEEITP